MAGGQGLGLVFLWACPKERPGWNLGLICSDLCIQKLGLDHVGRPAQPDVSSLVVYQSGTGKPVYSREPSQTAEFDLRVQEVACT